MREPRRRVGDGSGTWPRGLVERCRRGVGVMGGEFVSFLGGMGMGVGLKGESMLMSGVLVVESEGYVQAGYVIYVEMGKGGKALGAV